MLGLNRLLALLNSPKISARYFEKNERAQADLIRAINEVCAILEKSTKKNGSGSKRNNARS